VLATKSRSPTFVSFLRFGARFIARLTQYRTSFLKNFAQVFNANRFGVDMSQFPTIQRINAVLEERDEFKAAHPDAQPDKPPSCVNTHNTH
jgi:glutathione S-transferase